MRLSEFTQFKNDLLKQATTEEMEIYVEDMFNGNMKETSAFTMAFDYDSFIKELEQTDKNLWSYAVNWTIK